MSRFILGGSRVVRAGGTPFAGPMMTANKVEDKVGCHRGAVDLRRAAWRQSAKLVNVPSVPVFTCPYYYIEVCLTAVLRRFASTIAIKPVAAKTTEPGSGTDVRTTFPEAN